ncbi:unnamed protein product, partial [Medioppia subpectinata]
VCPLESLSTHLKTCQHKLCQTCGLSVGLVSDDHNCIEGLKRDRNEWTQRAKEFEIRLKESNEKTLNLEKKYNSQQNEWQTKCNEWIERVKQFETKTKEMDQKVKELETKLKKTEENLRNFEILYKQTDCLRLKWVQKYQDLEISVKTSAVVAKQVIPLAVIPKCLLFGRYETNVGSIEFKKYDLNQQFIIIELRDVLSETFVSQLCEKCNDNGKSEHSLIASPAGQLKPTNNNEAMVGFVLTRFVDLSAIETLALEDLIKCSICLQVLNKAVDTRCGHTFCRECLNDWLSRPQTSKECPECRQPLPTRKRTRSQTTADNSLVIGGNVLVEKSLRINAMIGKLKIRCDYEWNGCPEVCPLESLSTHLKTCEYRLPHPYSPPK